MPAFMLDGRKHIYTQEMALIAFWPSRPVDSAVAYCDRNISIADLMTRLRHYCLIGITGERGVGKTSLLKIIHKLITGDSVTANRYGKLSFPNRTILVNSASSLDELLDLLVGQLVRERPPFRRIEIGQLEELSAELGYPHVAKLRAAISTRDRWEEIRKVVIQRLSANPSYALRLVLDVFRHTDLRIVVLIDEAERFPDCELRKIGDLIKTMESYNIVFCIAGILDSLGSVVGGHSSLPRAYEEYSLMRFSASETEQLFKLAHTQLGDYVLFSSELIEKIHHTSCGIPAIVQKLGYEILLRSIGDDWSKFSASVRECGPFTLDQHAIRLATENVDKWFGHYVGKWQALIERSPTTRLVLERLSEQPEFTVEVPNIARVFENIDDAENCLSELCPANNGTILRFGTSWRNGYTVCKCYSFNDPLFGWLVWMKRNS